MYGIHLTYTFIKQVYAMYMGVRDDPQNFVEVVYKEYVGYIELVVIYQAYAIYIPYIY